MWWFLGPIPQIPFILIMSLASVLWKPQELSIVLQCCSGSWAGDLELDFPYSCPQIDPQRSPVGGKKKLEPSTITYASGSPRFSNLFLKARCSKLYITYSTSWMYVHKMMKWNPFRLWKSLSSFLHPSFYQREPHSLALRLWSSGHHHLSPRGLFFAKPWHRPSLGTTLV